MRKLLFFAALTGAFLAFGERQVIDGVTYECRDGVCWIVDDEATDESAEGAVGATGELSAETPRPAGTPTAVAQGYRDADAFVAFLEGQAPREAELGVEDPSRLSFGELVLFVLGILLGGFLMNLTPCVLPMIPINLMIIGKSAVRGAWYGLGIALAYGTLGVLAAVGGLAFGTIQSSPWFNLAIALLFVALALALSGVFFIDLSKGRGGLARRKSQMLPWLFAFFMGVVSAVLAGACVAPILISVLLMTGKLFAEGRVLALGLPFVLGLGMALPWPFLGAGLQVLPKPGAWMKWVNRVFALVVLGFASWYARLAWLGFAPSDALAEPPAGGAAATPASFAARLGELRAAAPGKPVLVDCWATWCKNCAAMDRVLESPKVAEALARFAVLRLQAEDLRELKKLPGFEEIKGLPAFVIFE